MSAGFVHLHVHTQHSLLDGAIRLPDGVDAASRTATEQTPQQVIAGQWKVNDIVEGTKFPKVPEETIHNIIYENWKQVISV